MLRAAVAGALLLGSCARASDYAPSALTNDDVCKYVRATVKVTVTVTDDGTAKTAAAAETVGYGKPGGGSSPNVNHGYDPHGKHTISGAGPDYENGGWLKYASSAVAHAASGVKSKWYGDAHDGDYDGGYAHDGAHDGGYVPVPTSKKSATKPGYGHSVDSYPAATSKKYGSNSDGSYEHDSTKPSSKGGNYGGGAHPAASSKSTWAGYGYGKHNTTSTHSAPAPVDPASKSSKSSSASVPSGSSSYASIVSSSKSSSSAVSSVQGSSSKSSSLSSSNTSASASSGDVSSSSSVSSKVSSSSGVSSSGSSSASSSAVSASNSSSSASSQSLSSSEASSSSVASSTSSSVASSTSSSVASSTSSSASEASSSASETSSASSSSSSESSSTSSVASSSSTESSTSSLASSTSSAAESSSSSSTITSLSSDISSTTSSALTSSSSIAPVCILEGQGGCSASSPCCAGSTCGVDGVCRVCQAYNQVINGGFEFGRLDPVWTSSIDGFALTEVTSGSSADSDGFVFAATIVGGTVTLTQQVIYIRGGSTVFCSAFGKTFSGLSGDFSINIDGVPCASATISTIDEFEQFSGQLVVTGDEHVVEVVLTAATLPQMLIIDAISIVPIAGDEYNLECTATGPVPQNCDIRGFSDNYCSYKGTQLGAACGARIVRPGARVTLLFTMNPNNFYRCLNLCAQEPYCDFFSFQRDSGGNTCWLYQIDETQGPGEPIVDVAYDVLSVRGYKLAETCAPDDLPVETCTSPQCTIFGTDSCSSCSPSWYDG